MFTSLSFLSLILAQSSGQKPGQNTGVTAAREIVEGAEQGSELIVNAFKQDWLDFANGQSAVYLAVVSVSMLIAVVLVSFWSLGWYRQISEEGFSHNVISEMVFPLIVILLLSNNGAMMANLTLGLRTVTVKLNSSILAITKNGVTLKDAIRNVNLDQSFVLAAQTRIAECDKLPTSKTDEQKNTTNPRQQCIDKTIQQIQAEAQKTRKRRGLSSGSGSWNPLDMGGEMVNNAIQGFVYIILSGLSVGFQYIIQLSFLLVAYVAPIFLVLSLLPVGAKPIYAWLSGWLGLTLVLVSYSIIVGIVASSIVNQPSTNPLLTQLMQAIFSPLLAVAIGTGGGMSVFTAFTSGVKFSVGLRR
ncbi:type IV secretion system protein [Dendronalium sp. ChiSLP03b]|uniref:type IV secretion system protein n=1 Tax=Dendronalium sp. ChiSLP03b TaxID=3075381 RepID=UPI002AD2A950|nr:type IV secretion system protein [Dendronalium sp. ChiSLP03b]MDZ8208628.1 type IV secretion system protein [Dendronalium sp. ChiSLP03b]